MPAWLSLARLRELHFRYLRTKLTVLYAGLFGAGLIGLSFAVQAAVTNNAANAVRSELIANGEVFDRFWEMRESQLRDSADILAHDFGFRDAVSTKDAATIRSALNNLTTRLGIDRAFIMNNDGEVIGLDSALSPQERDDTWRALDSGPNASGVLMIDGAPYQAVSAPVLAPDQIGWVVFAAKLDKARMASFQKMAAIPLRANVFTREDNGSWKAAGEAVSPRDSRQLNKFLKQSTENGAPRNLKESDGAAIALVRPLDTMSSDHAGSAVLLLSYPLALAMAPYNVLLLLIAGLGALCVPLLALGSWALSRNITRPIGALDDAALRLQSGEGVHVEVQSRDEIGRLADSFNTMAGHIRERERRISHLALHDLETDLPNRRALEGHLQMLIDAQGQKPIAVAVIGIDRFHHMRGAIGYQLTGDLVRELGLRLMRSAPNAHASRISADMLCVIVEGEDADELTRAAQTLQRALETPIRLGGSAVDVTVTIGLSAWRRSSASVLVNQASIAVDQARALRRKVSMFDAEAYGDPAQNLSLISEIFDGITKGDVSLHFQPKFDIRRQQITGAEALMRWKHPVRGWLSPDLFITMAEETGHIHDLTNWVLRQAIADQAHLRAAGHHLPLAVNISGRLVGDEAFASDALGLIERSGANLCFEITETAVIDSPTQALKTIERCRSAGVGVSIDDYGSGLSSLAYLKQIRANELKIDKAFVLSTTDSARDALLVKSTIDLAHGLGMKVVAEGVETGAALALLSGMGCDIAQGYFIGRPMMLEQLIERIDTQTAPNCQSAAAL